MRSILRAAACLCLALLASACIVETETTLSDPDPKLADARLVGTWYRAAPGEVTIISVVADEDKPGAYRVAFANVNVANEGAVEGTRYLAWGAVVNGRPFLTIQRTGGSAQDMPKRAVIAYEFGGDGKLVLRMMQAKHVIAAIEAGKLEGRFKKGRFVDEAVITSDRAKLAAFLAAADYEALFAIKTDPLHKLAETAD